MTEPTLAQQLEAVCAELDRIVEALYASRDDMYTPQFFARESRVDQIRFHADALRTLARIVGRVAA